MPYLLKSLIIILVILGVNHLMISYLPPVTDIDGDKLISIFPPTWESSLNVGETSFGYVTIVFLITLTIFAVKLKKIKTENPFSNDLYILLLSSVFINDGTFLITMLFVTIYTAYVFLKLSEDDSGFETLPVVIFAITMFSFSAFIMRYKIHSPDLVVEAVVFLVFLFIIRLIRQYYSNNKEKIMTIVN